MSAPDPARSAQMALIRHKDTKPELRVRKALHASGLRYRLHDKALAGRPDIVLPGRGIVVFVDGCFFHQHPGCSRARMPKSRLEFWEPKLRRNIERDQTNKSLLTQAGWLVLTIWECETEKSALVERLTGEILAVEPSRQQIRLRGKKAAG